MKISNSDLELICNFYETSSFQPKMIMSYLDFEEVNSEEKERAIKRKKRQNNIDIVLGEEKIEDEPLFDNGLNVWGSFELEQDSFFSEIAPKIKSVNVSSKNYYKLEDIYKDIMKNLEHLTSVQAATNFNSIGDYKKIISRINMLSNLIASDSRVGIGNTVIFGTEAFKYITQSIYFEGLSTSTTESGILKGNLMGLNIVISELIKPNKIIVMRVSKKCENGLNVSISKENSKYFIKETPDWNKVIKWFEII